MISTEKPGSLGSNAGVTAPQVQQQVNRNAGVMDLSGGNVPRGLAPGSLGLTSGASNFSFFRSVGTGRPQQFTIPNAATNPEQFKYLPYQTGNGAPTTANYPVDGNYGYYEDTATSFVYLDINHSGTLKTQNLQTLAGTITSAQHAYQGAATASTMHSFVQITGTITAAQHGNFTAASANDSLHALATTAFNGFLSSSGFSLLDGATNATVANSLVRRTAAGNANFDTVNLVTIGGGPGALLIDGVNSNVARVNDITATGAAANILNATTYYLNGTAIIDTTRNITAAAVTGTAGAAYGATEQAMINDLKTLANDIRTQLLNVGGLFT